MSGGHPNPCASGDLEQEDPEITWKEVRRWLEFSCWTTLLLSPLLYWFNGPAVSTDQFVVRTGLIVIAAIGAIVLRLVAWFSHN
jgi:hypothetical protein